MNLSYFRINLPMEQAIEDLRVWIGKNIKERTDNVPTAFGKNIDAALDENNQWKGQCLYVYENEDWTIFEDMSGGLTNTPAKSWLKFAKDNEFIFAGYNDAIMLAEYIYINNGNIIKEYFEDMENPEYNINNGEQSINSFDDVADFVDEESSGLVFSESGTVLIF